MSLPSLPKPTSEQSDIITYVLQKASVVVKASAGTGKTSTLVFIAYALLHLKILYLAFGKAIELEAKERFPSNVLTKTTHAIAYRCVAKIINLRNVRGEYKPLEIADKLNLLNRSFGKVISLVFQEFCNSAEPSITYEFIKKAAIKNIELASYVKHGEKVMNEVAKYATTLFEMMKAGTIPPTHSFYLKFYQLSGLASKERFDVILLDEAQDTNEVTLDILRQLKGQKIVVGDDDQKIFGFRGSLSIMNMFPDATILPLTQSFRFNQTIADHANRLLGLFKGSHTRIVGLGTFDTKTLIKSEAYITRTNAEIINLIVSALEKGIYGDDWKTVRKPDEIFALPLSLVKLFINPNIDYYVMPQFQWLKDFRSLYEIEAFLEENEDPELKTAVKTAQNYAERLLSFLHEAQIRFINTDANTFFTTAHTSKGLEWHNVTVCTDFISPIDQIANHFDGIDAFIKAKGPTKDAINEEINLLYVAMTRTKETLMPLFNDAELILRNSDEDVYYIVNDEIHRRHQKILAAKKALMKK